MNRTYWNFVFFLILWLVDLFHQDVIFCEHRLLLRRPFLALSTFLASWNVRAFCCSVVDNCGIHFVFFYLIDFSNAYLMNQLTLSSFLSDCNCGLNFLININLADFALILHLFRILSKIFEILDGISNFFFVFFFKTRTVVRNPLIVLLIANSIWHFNCTTWV